LVVFGVGGRSREEPTENIFKSEDVDIYSPDRKPSAIRNCRV